MRSSSSSLFTAALLGAFLVSTPVLADAPPPDETPPEVSIVTPKDGVVVPAGTLSITVEVGATDDESGVAWVKLEVDGKLLAKLEGEPWEFKSVSLEPGEHTLVAVARNYDGGDSESDPVELTWPEAPKADDAPKADSPKADAPKADAPKTDAKAEDAKMPQAEAEAKTKAEPTGDKKAEEKKGCSVSASRLSWGGAGVGFGFAILAGFVLRRRPGQGA